MSASTFAPKNRISATPHKKRKRSTKAELAEFYAALVNIVARNAPCTVRQVFYLAVVLGLCQKDELAYKRIQQALLQLRRTGVIPYDSILDNMRVSYGRRRFKNRKEFFLDASRRYALDYWQDESVNVEVWCESDSISGVLAGTVVDGWGLRLFVARGFSSESFLRTAALGLKADGRPAYVFVLSDYDPAGVSLAEDIAAKLEKFADPLPVTVQRIALDGEQVQVWGLPTHGLKRADSRAARFMREHGREACELEAVPPPKLRDLVSDAIAQHVDPHRIQAAKQEEELQRDSLDALPDWFWEAVA